MADQHARIALIHAVTVAIDPIHAAFAVLWPEAELVNILDDSLSPDRAAEERLSSAMADRIASLGAYAERIGSRGVLYTCSAFGPAIEAQAARAAVPVLKPNEAMFLAALEAGDRIGMLATFPPSVASMESEFRDEAVKVRPDARIETVLVTGAMDALKSGDAETHNGLLAEAAPRLAGCDAIMLAHFSTARAREAVERTVPVPVLTSPDCAARLIRHRVAEAAEGR